MPPVKVQVKKGRSLPRRGGGPGAHGRRRGRAGRGRSRWGLRSSAPAAPRARRAAACRARD